MNSALLRKSYLESRWLWITCAVVLFIFCWVHVTITSQVDMGSFESLLNTLPDAWEKFSPVPFKKLISYPARISVIFEEPLLYLLMCIWCIARSSDVVSGELGRGTMELLLAQPVSRARILLIPVLVTLTGAALLALVAWLGTCTGIALTSIERPAPGSTWTIPFTLIELGNDGKDMQRIPMHRFAQYGQFVPAATSYFCLGVFLTGICTLLSSLDSIRSRTIGITVGIYVASMLAELIGKPIEALRWLSRFSFLSAYEPIRFTSESVGDPSMAWSWFLADAEGTITAMGPMAGNSILVGIGVLGLTAALWIFCRRDLPAPV